MNRSFTCCVGTGMESHALHGLGLYYEAGDQLWVNLYAPSTAQWEAAGVKLDDGHAFPEGETATLKLDLQGAEGVHAGAAAPVVGRRRLRRPRQRPADRAVASKPGSYVEIKRTWKTGDTVALTLPKTLRLEPLPDNPEAGGRPLGTAGAGRRSRRGAAARDDGDGDGPRAATPEPVRWSPIGRSDEWLRPVAGKPGTFRAAGVACRSPRRRRSTSSSRRSIDASPHLHGVLGSADAGGNRPRGQEIEAERERVRALDAATIARCRSGDREGEKKFNQQGVETSIIRTDGRPGRSAKWFSYDLPRRARQRRSALRRHLQRRQSPAAQLRGAGRWAARRHRRRSRKAACRNSMRRNTRFPRS